MELPELGLGAVRTRQVEGRRREPGQAQDMDRAQTHHPPTRPGLGVEEQLLQAGNQGSGRARRGPLENARVWGVAALPVSTIETAGP